MPTLLRLPIQFVRVVPVELNCLHCERRRVVALRCQIVRVVTLPRWWCTRWAVYPLYPICCCWPLNVDDCLLFVYRSQDVVLTIVDWPRFHTPVVLRLFQIWLVRWLLPLRHTFAHTLRCYMTDSFTRVLRWFPNLTPLNNPDLPRCCRWRCVGWFARGERCCLPLLPATLNRRCLTRYIYAFLFCSIPSWLPLGNRPLPVEQPLVVLLITPGVPLPRWC